MQQSDRSIVRALRDLPVTVKVLAGALTACLGMIFISWVAVHHIGQLRDSGVSQEKQVVAPMAALDEVRRAYQTMIAAAVEEQTTTTAEMTRSVSGASERTANIALSVTDVANATTSTAAGAEQARAATAELSRMSAELFSVVGRFQT